MIAWCKKAVESGFLQRRISYYTVLGMTVFFGIETWEFIKTAPQLGYEGMEVSAILFAAWAPMTYLQGYVFTKHKEHEKGV